MLQLENRQVLSPPTGVQERAHPTVQCRSGLDDRLQKRFTYPGDRIPEYSHCIFRSSYEEVPHATV